MRHAWVFCLLLAATAAAAQAHRRDSNWLDDCRNRWHGDDQERYCEDRETSIRPRGGTIEVDGGQNGGAVIYGWDRDSIRVVAHVQASAETADDAEQLAKAIRIVTTNGPLHAEGPDRTRHEWWSVTFEMYVPRRSNLDVEAHNGPVAVEDVEGKMDLQTVNGPLRLTKVAGDVHGHTQNGPLVVQLGGTSWVGMGLDAETVNGPVRLAIPDRYSAHLETGTVNGPMDIGIPITIQGRLTRRISTDLGRGGATVRAVTTNGPVRIGRDVEEDDSGN